VHQVTRRLEKQRLSKVSRSGGTYRGRVALDPAMVNSNKLIVKIGLTEND
jgi:hypothetical protein